MSESDRTMPELREELERLRKRVAKLESCGAGAQGDEELEIRDQAIRSSINGIALADMDGMLTFANPSFLAMWGYEAAREVLGRPAISFWESGEEAERIIEELVERGRWSGELTAERKNGSRFPVQLSASMIRGRTGAPIGMMASFLDITEQRRAERRVSYITRLYALLGQVNQAIVRARDRDELFRTICRVAVEIGQFKLAWIGLVDEASGIVRSVAHAGEDAGYLEMLTIRTGDQSTGKGPTGSAVRKGELVICDDIATDSRMLLWRDEALRRGYLSSAAIPFRLKNKVIGSLNLYAAETGFFTDDERKLLTELGIDISHALGTMEMEEDRKRAEEALREGEERYRSFFANAAVAVAITDRDGYVVEANDTDCRFLGYPHAELIGMHFTKFTHPEDIDIDVHLFRSLMAGERQGYEIEKRYVRKDGAVVWGRIAVSLIRDREGTHAYTLVVCTDITEAKRAAEALRESEERYRVLLDRLIHGVQENDCSGVITYSNRAHHRILGYENGELIGKIIWQLQPSDRERESLRDYLAYLVKQQPTPVPYVTKSRKKDGSVVDLQIDWDYLHDADGNLKGFISIVTDITESKRAAEALRMSEEKYRTLFDSATDGIFIMDFDGQFIDINQSGYTRLGYTKQEMLSLHVSRLDPPEFAARVSERLAQVSRSGMAVFESAHIRKDGSVMPVEISARLIDYEGRKACFGVVRDISVRKRLQEAVRQSEERLQFMMSNSPAVIYTCRPSGDFGATFITENVVHQLGHAAEDFLADPGFWAANIHPDDRQRVFDGLSALFEQGTHTHEYRFRHKDGTWRWMHDALKLVRNADGDPAEILGSWIDITDRRRSQQERLDLERRLLHAQKLESLGVLAGGIAHDFNNLLMAILGNLDLALRNVPADSPVRANIEKSAQAARRAADLTRQMLAYSGKGKFVLKAMDLNGLVEENAHLFRSSAARTATLDVRLGRPLPSIEADTGQVQQVIMNLITNASEAIGEASGRIAITTGVEECDTRRLMMSWIDDVPPPGRFVCLEVSDTGCGMDEQTQQRLFDPFFSTKAPGRGLGMSAILGIVRGHGGAIFVDSSPGGGTSIRILFPALGDAGTESGAEAGGHAAETGAAAVSGTVLVADDEEIVRMVCQEMVELMGLPVLTAVDGRDAVEIFRKHAENISCVILDLSMPNMDGVTAFTELVRIKPGVKVILSSGYDEQESMRRMPGKGFAGFIQKPYSFENLRDALEKATRR